MNNQSPKQTFLTLITKLFQNYPHFKHTTHLKESINSQDDHLFESWTNPTNLNIDKLLYDINKDLNPQILNEKLSELQQHIVVQNLVFQGLNGCQYSSEEIQDACIFLNNQHQKILNELFTIIEDKKLVKM